jgi:RNA polymerase I-specific transcription initiation factor RRN6
MADLNYGHPGAAAYDLESRDWSFARQYTTRTLKQVRTLNGIHPATTLATPTSVALAPSHASANNTSVHKEVRSRIRDNPQCAPAAGFLPKLSLVSSAILSTASTYDPLIGSLVSFGSVTLEDKYEDPRRIAALATGEGGNILRLAFLNQERLSWRMDRSVWVDGLTLKDAHCGYWNEEAAPIQQLCFAQSEDRSSLLAVRLPTRTVFFRPVYHRRAEAPGHSPFYNLPASTIDAHPILSIDSDDTGGFSHTDVTFNPDFQLQFALVDQSQTWSVWSIEQRRQIENYSASCLVRGSIGPSEESDMDGEDGWSRILWVAGIHTLLVCNRRHLSIISIRGESATYLACPSMFSGRSADWILDVKRHPKHRGRVFVLTSTCLVLLAVPTSSDHFSTSTAEPGATIIASWRHYRGAGDFTLQMSVQMASDDGKLQ